METKVERKRNNVYLRMEVNKLKQMKPSKLPVL